MPRINKRLRQEANAAKNFLTITNPITWVMGIGFVFAALVVMLFKGWQQFWDYILG